MDIKAVDKGIDSKAKIAIDLPQTLAYKL